MKTKTLIILLVVMALIGGLTFLGWRAYNWLTLQITPRACFVKLESSDVPLTLTAEQASNAAIIVAVSFKKNLSEQAAVIALATAWQESSLRNIDYGDRDSLGLFQQRPSYGWGTEEELLDPWYSSGAFYDELVKFPEWETTDVNDIAQAVQRSGHPEAYRKHVENAQALAGALRGSRPATLSCSYPEVTASDATKFEDVVASVPGVKSEVSGTTVTLSAPDETSLWAATQLALANTRDAGLVSAQVGGLQWRNAGGLSWQEDGEATGPLEAKLELFEG